MVLHVHSLFLSLILVVNGIDAYVFSMYLRCSHSFRIP
jgi:hypothetical protein